MLNTQQEVFCQHYALSRNGAESARMAGYSARSANNQASRLLEREDIQNRIEELSQELTTNVDVILELEKQYLQAKANGQGQTAIKALEMLSRIRGPEQEAEIKSEEDLEKEVVRLLEILGENKAVELLSRCNWVYSKPTVEELPEEVEEEEEEEGEAEEEPATTDDDTLDE